MTMSPPLTGVMFPMVLIQMQVICLIKWEIRKSQPLENFALAVLGLAKEGDLIPDFCCGSGHLGILLAYLLPKCTIILLENKEQSLLRARLRVHEMGLKNVYF